MNKETQHLFEVMSDVSGESIGDLMGKGRRKPLPTCRYLVGIELMARGYSANRAAWLIGLNHATLLHGRKVIEGMRSNPLKCYAEEFMIDVLFRRAIMGSESV